MKIKQDPDDFRVEELSDFLPGSGPFALYRLEKMGWTTHDAINTIRRRWKIPHHLLSYGGLSYGGLKDRHARTIQYLTIEAGPTSDLNEPGIALTYLGQAPRAFTSECIRANRFVIVVRDLSMDQVALARIAIEDVRRDGLANYFDDQRFGSVNEGGEFIGRCMVLERWEEALKLALTSPYEFDRSAEKRQKAILRKRWGDWHQCRQDLPECHARKLVEHLIHAPSDFRGAIGRMRGDLTGLYLSAYQSHLWNRLLANWLTCRFTESNRIGIRMKLNVAPFPKAISAAESAELNGLSLPLPSARLKYEDAIPNTPHNWPEVLRETLAEDTIELSELRLKGLRRPFFSRGERLILCRPADFASDVATDDRHSQRFKLSLKFELPRGSYATLLVKRVTT
jgi:tRNA pseudouridine13 synthase